MDLLDAVKLGNSMTNDVYLKDNRIIRFFGHNSDKLINREREVEIMHVAGAEGLGPKVLEVYPDRRVEEYLGPSLTLTNKEMHTPQILERIAKKLQQFHALVVPGPRDSILETRLRLWSELSGIKLPPTLLEGLNTNNVV